MAKHATIFVAAFFLCFIIPLAASANGVRFVSRPMPAFRPMQMMRPMTVYRPAPVMRPGVVRQGFSPRQGDVQGYNREPMGRGFRFGRRAYDPNVFQGIRPGRMTVYGRSGLHPVRNQTKWATIGRKPGLIFTNADGTVSDEGSLDIEQMIDDTDLSVPLEPVSGCTGDCKWGAVAISNDGAAGTAWNYGSAEDARQAAIGNCLSSASEQCFGYVAVGSAWIAGVQCEVFGEDGSSGHRSNVGLGDDLGAAIRNAFRTAVQDGTYALDQCALRAYVAVNGDHTIIDQPVPEPVQAEAANPEPLPQQPPVIEARSVAEDGPKPSSFWTFYGSDMYMTKSGSERGFFFDTPRSGLSGLGIAKGSPFFEGSIDGSSYKGKVLAYAKNCPSITFPVAGKLSVDEKHITFVGNRPTRDEQCNIIAMKKVTITFDFNRGADVSSAE